jgi:hypothetical protein
MRRKLGTDHLQAILIWHGGGRKRVVSRVNLWLYEDVVVDVGGIDVNKDPGSQIATMQFRPGSGFNAMRQEGPSHF